MTPDELHAYCLAKPGARLDEPWDWAGDETVKVGGRIFAFLGEHGVGVKCGAGREEADEWLARYPDDASAMPPYVGRFGWNLLRVGGAIGDDELRAAVDESYAAAAAKLPKSRRP